jgi:hypothetical protein
LAFLPSEVPRVVLLFNTFNPSRSSRPPFESRGFAQINFPVLFLDYLCPILCTGFALALYDGAHYLRPLFLAYSRYRVAVCQAASGYAKRYTKNSKRWEIQQNKAKKVVGKVIRDSAKDR